MLQLRAWKVAMVALAAVFGLVFALPNAFPHAALPGVLSQRLNLGLDLQGGSYLLYEVDTGALLKEQLGQYVESARTTLTDDAVAFTDLGVANGQVSVRINDPAKLDAAAKALQDLSQPLPGTSTRDLDLVRGPDQQLVLRPAANWAAINGARAVDRTIEIIRRRIDQLGTREPSILKQGTDRIVVEAPGESDPEKLRAVIGRTAKLTFQMVSDLPLSSVVGGVAPPGTELMTGVTSGAPPLLVERRQVVSGEDLVDARAAFDQNNTPAVSFRFDGRGSQRFGEASSQNIGKRFAIVLDGKYLSAPVIQTAILGGSGEITGSFTQDEVNNLSLLLRSGALPAPLNVIEQRQVGAELGADAVRAGTISLAIGAVAIIVFIVAAYGLFGVFAAVALIVNVLMLIAILSLTQATLTLPGVAGIILTLAVAVDANVLIYERMRDEARAGRTPLLAADQGFRRALVSIVDANVTTLIAAAIMFQFGSGPVRGFAWTLAVGVLTSLFTAIFITQVLIGWWFRATKPKALPI